MDDILVNLIHSLWKICMRKTTRFLSGGHPIAYRELKIRNQIIVLPVICSKIYSILYFSSFNPLLELGYPGPSQFTGPFRLCVVSLHDCCCNHRLQWSSVDMSLLEPEVQGLAGDQGSIGTGVAKVSMLIYKKKLLFLFLYISCSNLFPQLIRHV